MGKLRIARKATKGKGKRWKKGSSSSSNPEHKQFREHARRGPFGASRDSGRLTQDLLDEHNAQEGHVQDTDNADECESIGGKTFETFASGFSDCSNPSFNRLMRNWHASSALHKEMLAVLAAVAEVIKERDGKETETEYFAALMLTLETVETDESRTAVVGLLGMVMKRLPPSVLKAKFSDVSKVFVDLLGKYGGSDHISLLRGLIGCLSVLLRAQECAVWSTSSTLHIFNTVLFFTTHPKPKVRKAGQHAVCSILKGSNLLATGNLCHPATAATAKYCVKKIEECGGSGQATTTLHILGFLKDVLGCFSKDDIKSVCETLLRVMLLSSPLVKSCTLNTLSGLFRSKTKELQPDLVGQLVNALYNYQPGLNDNQSLVAWLSAMYSALVHLASQNKKLCLDHSVKFFTVACNCWLSDKEDVIYTVTNILKDMLHHCISPCADDIGQLLRNGDTNATPGHKLVKCLEGTLKYQYHSVWSNVLSVFTVAFQVLGKQCPSIFGKCLQCLAELRNTQNFALTADLDKAIGTAVRMMGPEVILQAIPFSIDSSGDSFDIPGSWLIPVIRDHVQETKLQFFIKSFLPVAIQLRNKVLNLNKEGRKIEAKTFDVLQLQIWSLLPGFCTKPSDLTESFKGIAKTLGITLNERPDLRLVVLSAIRNLISKSTDNASNRQELSRFAKNFLPILFNLYTTEPGTSSDNNVRLAVFDTIKAYLRITDSVLIVELFQKVVGRLEGNITSEDSFTRHAIMDLSRALLPYLDTKQVIQVYNFCKPLLQHEDRTIQKKAYRVMEEICQNQSKSCVQTVGDNFPELQEMLLLSLHKANPSSKAPRLRCLTHIVRHLKEENLDFTSALLPEAVLCVKETSEKARTAAFSLLLELGRAEQRWNSVPADAVQGFIKKVVSGLLGTPHVISATLCALAAVFYEFKDHISRETTEQLIEHVCLLLTAKSREVVQSALAFMKTLFDSLSSDDLVQYLPQIMTGLTSSSDDCQRHFRFKVKVLFIRLVRKFGYEAISKMVPENYQKVMSNIRKTEARKARLKSSLKEGSLGDRASTAKHYDDIGELLEDSEDSGDEEEVKEPQRRAKSSAYIEEAGDEIVDFLDQKVNQKITAVRPFAKVQGKVKHGFKTAPDGRLIITEDNEEKSTQKTDSSTNYLMEAAEFAKKGQKRKHTSESDDEDTAVFPGDKKGIHRKNPKNTQDGSMYKAKKAKGDVKKIGKHDPYAYIPLKALNKRNKAKFSKQFSNIVKSARKGAAKGTKAKLKKNRNRK